jgi:hypothetical protein
MPPRSALGRSDIQRVDVAVVVADLEPTEFAVPAAGEEGRVREIAKAASACIEQSRDLVVGQIADDGC